MTKDDVEFGDGTITIFGITYSDMVFDLLAHLPVGNLIRITDRRNGVVTACSEKKP